MSPLGVEGVGESGCTASIPVLVAAVIDALRPPGIQHLDMPLTPYRLWQAISAATAGDNCGVSGNETEGTSADEVS